MGLKSPTNHKRQALIKRQAHHTIVDYIDVVRCATVWKIPLHIVIKVYLTHQAQECKMTHQKNSVNKESTKQSQQTQTQIAHKKKAIILIHPTESD